MKVIELQGILSNLDPYSEVLATSYRAHGVNDITARYFVGRMHLVKPNDGNLPCGAIVLEEMYGEKE